MSPRLAFAVEAAYRAGRMTLEHFQTGVAVERKSDASPVTVADRGAERIIREMLAEKYPGDAILGEEEGGDLDADDRWVIDPIDGTKSFVSGVPLYATLIGYEQAGQPILGVCYFPALDEMVYAEVGAGAFVNGRPCRVSQKSSLADSVLSCGGLKSMVERDRWPGFADLSQRTLATRTWSDAYGHALVATGRIEAMVDPVVSRWDLSALKVIVQEAGGRFTDFRNEDPFLRGNYELEAISTNGRLHEEVLRAFER